MAKLTVSGFQTILKKRPGGGRWWILCLTAVYSFCLALDKGMEAVTYLFYRRQYQVTNTQYANLGVYYTVMMFIAQVSITISNK